FGANLLGAMVGGVAEYLSLVTGYQVLLLLVAAAYIAYHGVFLHLWKGQSPGRRTFDISVVSFEGGDLNLVQAVLRSVIRPGVVVAVTVPVYYVNRFDLGIQIAAIVLLLETGLMLSTRSRRTGADLASATLVVNTPPLQPHRAPAVPMYSARDAEFGYPPQRPKRDK
ncbi:MAG: RDD family protein, partial [Burkholderiales bacterium]